MVNEQQVNILGIVAGLFNAAPGEQFLTEFTAAVDAGLTETQLAGILAAHPVFTNGIMGDQNTTSSQVAVLMNHYGLVADGVTDSAASQAEDFFTNSINSDVGFDAMIIQAGVFLLSDSVPAEFTETANLFKNKITVAGVYSASNSSTDLATLQSPLAGLSGETVMTPEDATTFLQNGGIIPNPNSATLDEAIDGPLAGPIELKDVSDTFTLNIISADDSEGKGGAFDVGGNVLVTLEDPAGTTAGGDAETLTLNATINDDNGDTIADGINAQTITVAGVENLVISSTVASTDGSTPDTEPADHILTAKLIAADAETITVTGNGGVKLGSNATPFSETTIGNVTKINAAGSTGNVMINLAAHTQSVAYTGSDGVDTYWGSSAGDIIIAGKGHDFLNLEGGLAAQDILVLKAVTDSNVSDTNNDGQITILDDRGFDEVENFKVGAASTDDRLDLSFLEFTGIQQGIVDVSAKVPAFDTDLTSIPDLFSDAAGDRGLAFSVIALPPELPFPPQSFVFIDANKDGDFTAADDMLVELQGAGPISEAIFIF
jgi:hypothetical protein